MFGLFILISYYLIIALLNSYSEQLFHFISDSLPLIIVHSVDDFYNSILFCLFILRCNQVDCLIVANNALKLY